MGSAMDVPPPELPLPVAAENTRGCDKVESKATKSKATIGEAPVKSLLVIVGWSLLFVLCWPLALLAIVLWPLLWLLSLPFRLIGISFEALFALLRAILFLPARLLGYRD